MCNTSISGDIFGGVNRDAAQAAEEREFEVLVSWVEIRTVILEAPSVTDYTYIDSAIRWLVKVGPESSTMQEDGMSMLYQLFLCPVTIA